MIDGMSAGVANGAGSSSAVAVFLLVGTGVIVSFIQTAVPVPPLEYWKTTGPLISLVLWFIFGKRS